MRLLTVAQLNGYLKEIFDCDDVLQNIWVNGEVSNCSRSPAGHLYFTLKDGQSQIRCVAFRAQIARLGLQPPNNGEAILAHGRISIYEAQGSYQLYVDTIQRAGTGALHLQFEELRARLEAEGLFDPARKRPLPAFPQRIGIVTSPTGAVLHDVVSVLSRRYPLAELILAPATVQGDGAAPSICQALEALNRWGDVEVIIVGRGGGSLEELWAFNEESVARAIYASRRPVVSAVGHETDYTIADLVADQRAPTPSAAAELISPDLRECQALIERWRGQITSSTLDLLATYRGQLNGALSELKYASPSNKVMRSRQQVDDLLRLASTALDSSLTLRRERVYGQQMRLASLNPLAVLNRGYSICYRQDTGQVITSVQDVSSGAPLSVRVSDGAFPAKAE